MSARSVFADLLATYRKDAGWTQAEAARQFSMSKSLYQKIEACDRKPQRDMAERCDELFGTHGVFALNMVKGCALSPGDSRQLIADIRG